VRCENFLSQVNLAEQLTSSDFGVSTGLISQGYWKASKWYFVNVERGNIGDKLQPRNINVSFTNNSNVAIDIKIFTFYNDQLTIDVETGIVQKYFFLELNIIISIIIFKLRMLDPKVLRECPIQGRSLTAVLISPPTGGYVAILKDPIESAIQWHDSQISTSEGISTSTDFHHPFQIEGARWHLLRTLALVPN
jgi:hypothetical protein